MSKQSKKLLSWLCVVAMVLSMAPVLQLPAFAAETAEAETYTPDETVTSAVSAEAQAAIEKAATIRAEAATLDFSGNYCPACGPDVEVTWTKLTRSFPGSNNDNGATPNFTDTHPHFYWDPADFTDGTAVHSWMNWLQNTKSTTNVCLHLNGMTFNNVYSRIHWTGGTLNIMGDGTFINSGDSSKQSYGIFQVNGGTVNVYGGTFVSSSIGLVAPSGQNTYYATVGLNKEAAVFNMYEGVTLELNSNSDSGTNVAICSGTFNMYGGEIKGGKGYAYYDTSVTTSGTSAEIKASYDSFEKPTGGNVFMRYSTAKFNMYGGKITGGTANRGGNIAMYDSAVFTQYAGEITGGTATETAEGHGGGNVKIVSGTFTQNGGVIQNGTAGYGGNIDTRSKVYIKGLVKDGTATNGANILAASGCLLYIQDGGRVLRGNNAMNIMVYGSGNLYMQGGLIYGGVAKNGANIYLSGNGNLQVSGGVIRDGVAETNGGNIFAQNKDSKVVISGGEILNGKTTGTTGNGGNIRVTQGQLTISGGTISGGEAVTGGNIYYYTDTASTETVAYGTYMLQVTGGTITDGKATGNGGNIYAQTKNGDRTLNIDNAVISGGEADGAGGNVYVENANANIGANAQLLGGISNSADYKGGGNIAFSGAKTLTTAGIIKNGKTTNAGGGGNISVMSGAALQVTGGVIANGRTESDSGTAWGGNIRAYNNNVTISGGLIYGGYSYKSASDNIGVLGGDTTVAPQLTITGGTIVGDIEISNAKTYTAKEVEYQFPGTAVTISGAPQILKSYQLQDGTTVTALTNTIALSEKVDISGLTADARICVRGNAGDVFTAPYTGDADLSQVFTPWASNLIVEQNDSGAFQLVKKPFEVPEKPAPTMGGNNYTDEAWNAISQAAAIQAEDMAAHVAAGTCPICGEVEGGWKEATLPGQFKTDGSVSHYYIDADTQITYNYNWCTLYGKNQTLCLALLNGNTPKEVNGLIAVRGGSVNGTINIMGDGIIVNNDNTGDKIGLLRAQGTNPTLNLYGGTFYRSYEETAGAKPKAALLVADAGTVNIFEGVTLGPDTLDTTRTNYNVRIDKGTVNMYGGTIQNGVSGYADAVNTTLTYRYSGNITMTNVGATFNMYGGTVKNGVYMDSVPGNTQGGNILGQVNKQYINIYGGTIEGGEAYDGGNIYLYGSNSKLTMMGGTVKDGVAVSLGGNIRISSPMEFGGYGVIENGEAKNYYTTTVDGQEVTYALGNGGGNIHISGNLTISGGEIRGGKITNTTQKRADGVNASPAGGNIYQGGGTLTMTGGVVKDGFVLQTATGGGNIYATSGAVITVTGGSVEGGSSNTNGGNIYIYRGNLTIGGDAVISGGNAGNAGGNIYKYGGDAGYGNTNTHFVKIGGNAVVKDGVAVKNGGNIYLNASLLELSDNAQIKDGQGNGGGNIYITGQHRYTKVDGVSTLTDTDYALFRMTGGSIGGGKPADSNSANVLTNMANVEMTGGLIYGTEGADKAGSSIRMGNDSVLYLDGDATIMRADGVRRFSVQLQGDEGTLRIAKTWTGSATAGFNKTFVGGDTVMINLAAEDQEPNYYYSGLVGTYTSTTDETTGKISFEFTEDTTEAGTFAGTLLQERAPEYYEIKGVNGKLVLTTAGIKTEAGMQWYMTNEEALAAYTDEAEFITLAGEVALGGESLKLNLMGNDLTVYGEGTIIGWDTENDDYAGYGKITLEEDAQIDVLYWDHFVDGKRYIAIKDGQQLSFHRIEMAFTAVTLRTEKAGIYYKAQFEADSYVASKVESFGTVLSLNDMPDNNFEHAEDINIATELSGDKFVSGQEITSASVFGILKDSRSQAQNTAYAQMKIYANLYVNILIEDGINTLLMAEDSVHPETAGSGVAYSLEEVLEGVNENWDNYSDEDKVTVQTTLNQWATLILPEAVAQLQTKLNNIFG